MNTLNGAWTFAIIGHNAVVPFGNVSAIKKLDTTCIEVYLGTGQKLEVDTEVGGYELLLKFQKVSTALRFSVNINDFIDELDLTSVDKIKGYNELLDKLHGDVTKAATEIKDLIDKLPDFMKDEFMKVRNDKKKLEAFITKARNYIENHKN